MRIVKNQCAGSQRIGLSPHDLIERDLRGAGLKFDTARAVERISEDGTGVPFGLAEDDRLIDERRLAAHGPDVLREASTEIWDLTAGQSPVQTMRLIQVHSLKCCV